MKQTGGGTKLVLSHNNCHQKLNLAIAGNHKLLNFKHAWCIRSLGQGKSALSAPQTKARAPGLQPL